MLIIDGRTGEGGGQLLRTCLSLSALTGRPFRLDHIRANRSRPGLRPQHLTAVRAAAAVCRATLSGAELDSVSLRFEPQAAPLAGEYRFDVADAARGGSAGSVLLIWQTVLWPLLFAKGSSSVRLHGGTHVPFSPPYHYVRHVVLPVYERFGVAAGIALLRYGWYPQGGGEVAATVEPSTGLIAPELTHTPLTRVEGVAVVTNLPATIPQRMAGRATNLLRSEGISCQIAPQREHATGPGAGIFLWAPHAGASALGRKGLPSEAVAEAAVAEMLAFKDNTPMMAHQMVDRHLADQLLLPAALATGESRYTTDRLTNHTVTQAGLLQRWLDVNIEIEGDLGQPAAIIVQGTGFARA